MTTSQGRRHSTNCVRRVVAFLNKVGSWQTHHKMYISDCQLERELRSSGIRWTSLSPSKTTKSSADHIIKRTRLFAHTLSRVVGKEVNNKEIVQYCGTECKACVFLG